MFFIYLILIDIAISFGYIVLSYVFRIRMNFLFIAILICIGNGIYLRWGGGGIQHIIPAFIIGSVAGGIENFGFCVLYFAVEDKLLNRFDLERPLCFMPERCPRCGSTRIRKHIYYRGKSYDHVIEDHSCNKCGYYWNYIE